MIQTIKKPISALWIMVLICGVLFTLFSLFPLKVDLSQGAIFTLASATKKAVRSADSPITIQAFISSDLPTRILPLKTDVVELLQEYRKATTQIKLVFIDPKKDEKMVQKAKELGIPALQFSQLEQNKYQVSSSYFGIAVLYKDKQEVIPQVTDFSNLEYNLTSAIYRLTKKEIPKIGLVNESKSGIDGSDNLSILKQTLAQQYTLVSLDLQTIPQDEKSAFTKEYKTILIWNDGEKVFETPEIELLRSYFTSGGNLLIFTDGVQLNEQTLTAQPLLENELNSFIATYGATINADLVLSQSAEFVNFGNQLFQFQIAYPFWIKTNGFSGQNAFFANISALTYPWTSSLVLHSSAQTKVQPIISSSNRSWSQNTAFDLNPETISSPKPSELKQFILGSLSKHNKGGTMIVIPTSRFVGDRYQGRGTGNINFVLNAVDSLSSGGALTGIKSRSPVFYPLPDISDSAKDLYKYGAILAFPLMWIIFGLTRLLQRR